MKLKRAIEVASGDRDNTETVTFRLSPEMKARFVALCKENNLSIGRLMRASVEELLNDSDK